MKYATAIAAVLLASTSWAHEWYDLGCCGGKDCAEIERDQVRIKDNGYEVITPSGDVVFIHQNRTLPSHDDQFHGCGNENMWPFVPSEMSQFSSDETRAAAQEIGEGIRCFYVPPRVWSAGFRRLESYNNRQAALVGALLPAAAGGGFWGGGGGSSNKYRDIIHKPDDTHTPPPHVPPIPLPASVWMLLGAFGLSYLFVRRNR